MICPNCNIEFTPDDQRDDELTKAVVMLVEHGMAYRAIGKLTSIGHPQKVKYRYLKATGKLAPTQTNPEAKEKI